MQMVQLDSISKRSIEKARRNMAKDVKRDVDMFSKLKITHDDPDKMLAESWIYYAVFWIAVLSLVFLSGCTPTATVQHEVPQLDRLAASAETAIHKLATQPAQCPTLAMPPIPQECVIDIRGDTMTASSKECESLIRHYVAARRLLRPVAPPSMTPTRTP
jgi:hypothetical protein